MYAGNYIYKQSNGHTTPKLTFFNSEEGYVEPIFEMTGGEPLGGGLQGTTPIVETLTGFEYTYQYKDHLGNIRLSYQDMNGDYTVDLEEIKEENHFYPFGLKHKGHNNQITGRDHQYGYLNQEEQNELGLGWISYKWRNADPTIGRFFGIDPIAEDYPNQTLYQFASNNPVWKIEIEGLEGYEVHGGDLLNGIGFGVHTVLQQKDYSNGGSGSEKKSKRIRTLPTDVKIDVKATMTPVLLFAGVASTVDGPAPIGDGVGGTAVVGSLAAVAILQLTIDGYNKFATIYNAVNDAKTASEAAEASENSEATSSSETSKTAKERAETANDLEAALNQAEGIEKAQDAAKREVKGEKQNKIRSVKKSQQRVKNALKRIDINDID